MRRTFRRPVAAVVLAAALAMSGATTATAVASAAPHARDAACDQATAAYDKVKAKHDAWVVKLKKAKKRLHYVHAHGTAAEFQQAKNQVRTAKGKVFHLKQDLAQAAALVAASC